MLTVWQPTAVMSSVSGPIATSPENTQPYSPFSNGVARTAGATSRKRKYDEHDPQDQLELGGPFTIEVKTGHLYVQVIADCFARLHPMDLPSGLSGWSRNS